MGEVAKKSTQKTSSLTVKNDKTFDLQVIDEYFLNGHNQTQAVLKLKPELSYSGARSVGSRIMANPENQQYIKEKQLILRQEANIDTLEILSELKSFAFADVTQYLGLSEAEVKQLPHEERRKIKKVTTVKKTFVDKKGGQMTEIKTVYEIHDKIKAFDMLAKHVGLYEEDNKQRNKTIDLTNATSEQLNAVLQIVEQQKKLNQNNR